MTPPPSPAALPAAALPRATPEEVGMSTPRLLHAGEVLRGEVAAGRMAGGVLAIARHGRLAWLDAFGLQDPATGVPMAQDSIFNAGAMAKPLTVAAALQLYERGQLLLDDPVHAYLPALADMRVAVLDTEQDRIVSTVPALRPIQIRDLMRHTSGLVYGGWGRSAVHRLLPRGSAVSVDCSGPEFVERLARAPLLHQPGAAWDYGFGPDVLGLVVEHITGMPLGRYWQAQIFAPLGMRDSGTRLPDAHRHRYAEPLPAEASGPVLIDPRRPMQFESGGACLWTTAEDYLRFALALLDGGVLGGTRVLARTTVERMVSHQLEAGVDNRIAGTDPTRAGHGFGLGVAVALPGTIGPITSPPGSFSWPSGSGTNWWADPREGLAVSFMALTPGPIRWRYRQLVNALVYPALET